MSYSEFVVKKKLDLSRVAGAGSLPYWFSDVLPWVAGNHGIIAQAAFEGKSLPTWSLKATPPGASKEIKSQVEIENKATVTAKLTSEVKLLSVLPSLLENTMTTQAAASVREDARYNNIVLNMETRTSDFEAFSVLMAELYFRRVRRTAAVAENIKFMRDCKQDEGESWMDYSARLVKRIHITETFFDMTISDSPEMIIQSLFEHRDRTREQSSKQGHSEYLKSTEESSDYDDQEPDREAIIYKYGSLMDKSEQRFIAVNPAAAAAMAKASGSNSNVTAYSAEIDNLTQTGLHCTYCAGIQTQRDGQRPISAARVASHNRDTCMFAPENHGKGFLTRGKNKARDQVKDRGNRPTKKQKGEDKVKDMVTQAVTAAMANFAPTAAPLAASNTRASAPFTPEVMGMPGDPSRALVKRSDGLYQEAFVQGNS